MLTFLNDLKSLDNTLKTIKTFSLASELKMNTDKTKDNYIGSLRNND